MNEKEKNSKPSNIELEKERLWTFYIEKYIGETQYYKTIERIKGKKKRG